MLWVNLGLIVLILTLALGLASVVRPRLWSIGRTLVPLGLQLAGVFIVTWLLVERGQLVSALLPSPPEQQGQVWAETSAPAVASLKLIAVAVVGGAGVGMGIAALIAWRRSAQLAVVATVASLVWIIPAFLIAIFAQDLQAWIYSLIGINVSGGFGQANTTQLLWCAAVLGLRPAAYMFRQGQVLLAEESRAQHVRTALAKGLPWGKVVSRHIIRPAAAGLIQTSINSLRIVVGLLPLVEFFFAYPGVGRLLLLSLGVPSAADQEAAADPAVAVACAVLLAAALVIAELPLRVVAGKLDPRLAEA